MYSLAPSWTSEDFAKSTADGLVGNADKARCILQYCKHCRRSLAGVHVALRASTPCSCLRSLPSAVHILQIQQPCRQHQRVPLNHLSVLQ